MRNFSLEDRVAQLEKTLKNHGVQTGTMGWNGEQLTVDELLYTTPRTAITPGNGWTNVAGYTPFSFTPISNECLLITGVLTGGFVADWTILGNIPFRWRPIALNAIPIHAANGAVNGMLYIYANGDIKIFQVVAGDLYFRGVINLK